MGGSTGRPAEAATRRGSSPSARGDRAASGPTPAKRTVAYARPLASERNIGYVAELTAAGRMQPEGIAEVDKAKADRRWARAYAGPATAEVPADLRAALDSVPTAAAAFDTLTSSNRYAIIRQVEDAKREETRARRIAKFVAKLSA